MSEPNAAKQPTMKGGTKDFNWQGIKNMSYRDRESYLGYTVKIGFLEKGAKWNKSDWWVENKGNGKRNDMSDEIRIQKEKDDKMMRIALGLEEREEEFELPKMTAQEAKDVTDKMKMEANEELPDEHREIVPGLGYKATNVNLNKDRSKKAMKDFGQALRLEGVGMEELMKIENQKADDLKRLEQEHNLKMRERKKRNSDDSENSGRNETDSIMISSKNIRKSHKSKKKKDKKKRKKEKSKKKKDKNDKVRLHKLYRI